ncbi:siderophore-interacting protein [Aquabacter sp. L1I39]|uniref:siderophore-interacting protein n=1 Tax=Aquabacter sp. L1I39 TaxID=2820278 RepID=UPI001ADBD314|nr:siderophore-interacting protein [Aquabacter sp. L1I39]QTL03956.1 siderophore-interacting protein [Aquabacter sp. L1I39]
MLAAHTTISFPRIEDFLGDILDSLTAHDMPVTPSAAGYVAVSPFGTARLVPGPQRLAIEISASSAAELNRVRYAITGLIGFVAKSEDLSIAWVGDEVGPTFPPDLRILTVEEIRPLTPRMRRVILAGEDLTRFDTPDQIHVRLLFQPEGVLTPIWPALDDAGLIVWPRGGQRLESRVYTVRHVDVAEGRLWIDIYDHGLAGPGAAWLRRARPGDLVGAVGPAAHGPKPTPRVLLVGDETGLPGIARILEEAAPATRGQALILVGDAGEVQPLKGPEGVEVRWILRAGPQAVDETPLCEAVRALDWGAGLDGLFVWVGCEFHDFRAIRHFLRDAVKLPVGQIVAFSHWRRGMSEEEIIAVGGQAVRA